jgi:molybdopterin-containing oxidoreductase family iron-sulfur binding subunit
MMQDLRRALKKPVEQRRWTMVIDLRKCIGCSACTVACIAENRLPPGVVYRPVVEEEVGTYPNVTRRFLPRPCMQCDNPPCVPVCPVAATYKRPDGVVEINYDKCIGCRYCISACPYGARYFDWGEYWTDGTPSREPYEEEPSHEYGREWRRRGTGSPVGNVRKCQFCLHRLEAGMLPACVTTCVGGATYFGDASDPESLVSELASSERAFRLKEELGTRPKVVYLR